MDKLLVYGKLQKVRAELLKKKIKKSGFNKNSNFYYYELADFLAPATELFEKYGLCPVYYITPKSTTFKEGQVISIPETAYLDVYDIESQEKITFSTPTAENEIWKKIYEGGQFTGKYEVMPQNGIQNLGAKKTYIKRYLYMDMLDLAETDYVDGDSDLDEVKEEPKKTPTKKPTKKTTAKKEEPKKDSDELMSATTKAEIVGLLTAKKLNVFETLDKIAGELKTDKSKLKESQKDEVIEKINKLGGEK